MKNIKQIEKQRERERERNRERKNIETHRKHIEKQRERERKRERERESERKNTRRHGEFQKSRLVDGGSSFVVEKPQLDNFRSESISAVRTELEYETRLCVECASALFAHAETSGATINVRIVATEDELVSRRGKVQQGSDAARGGGGGVCALHKIMFQQLIIISSLRVVFFMPALLSVCGFFLPMLFPPSLILHFCLSCASCSPASRFLCSCLFSFFSHFPP